MTTTTKINLTLVEQSQAQKEVTVNTAFTRIDALMNTGAKSRSINTPPGSPAAGDLYIVGGSSTGAWSGQANKLAYYDQGWKFITQNEGMSLWVNDEDSVYTYDNYNWVMTARAINQQPGALIDGANISWNLIVAPFAKVTLGGNRTLDNPVYLQPGMQYVLIVKQDATGSRTLAYGANYKWENGAAPVLSTAAGATDIITFVCDGTNMLGSIQKGFA